MKTYLTSATATLAISIAALSVACAQEESKPAAAPTTTTTTASTSMPLAPASPGKTNSSIYLSDRLRQACGITVIESAKEAPKFNFDQSAILPEDRDVLAQVAQCL